jgi:hypothetical protein
MADQWFGVRFHHLNHSTRIPSGVKRVVFTQQSVTRINSERIMAMPTGMFG